MNDAAISSGAPGRARQVLCLLGIGFLVGCVGLLVLSISFAPGEEDPPIVLALCLFAGLTVIYLLALVLVLRVRELPLRTILLFSILFRALLLPSWPILEQDYYRYLWDGRVLLAGISPYHWSPEQVEEFGSLPRAPAELESLWQASRQSASVQAIFEGVHYRGVPTAYPPISQATFAIAVLVTPPEAPLWAHVVIWKLTLLLFDVGTLLLLVGLLRRLRLPDSWCLAYGWCPLVLKEFANSGHFDAVAVFFTTLAVFWMVKAERPGMAALGMAALGLGVLAKSYPVVLVPVTWAFLLGRFRMRALLPLAAFPAVLVLAYVPFLGASPQAGGGDPAIDWPRPSHPGSGLGTFLSEWEMNDFLFMMVHSNLRSPSAGPSPWFAVVPGRWREALHHEMVARLDGLDLSGKATPAFLLTQALMGLTLLFLTLRWAWRTLCQPEPEVLLQHVFLTLAWAWLLTGAANPWYLVWSLPFMVFADRKSWFLLPGLALLYYSRPLQNDLFDYGLIWMEYVPFFLALAVESWWARSRPTGEKQGMKMRSKVLLGIGGTLAAAAGAVLIVFLTRPRVEVGGTSDLPRVPLAEVDHAPFDRLLHKYVDGEGLVAYHRWKADADDRKALDDYLARLGSADLAAPTSKECRLAFWINAYNALTLMGILREYPTTSIRNHTSPVGYNIWRDLRLRVDGKLYSLDNIEHDLLRKMEEPRIHFAIVCASKGCPPLRNEAYSAADLDRQLDANARQFFGRSANLQIDVPLRMVAISQLIEWYGADFAPTPVEQVRLLRRYFPSAEKFAWIESEEPVVSYLEYDWNLNDQGKP